MAGKFRYKYLFFDPVNLLKEVRADPEGAAAEYNRVRDVVRSRIRALDNAGFDVGTDLYSSPRAAGLSDVQMAQGLSAMYNYVAKKTSTVGGKMAANRSRSRALKAKGFNVEPEEVEAFGRFWNEITGKTASKLRYKEKKEFWNLQSENKKKELEEKISDAFDKYKDEYADELEEDARKWKQAEKEKRSAAAKKGWETRRRKAEEKAKRSAAAKKGWETRRRKKTGQ